MSQASATGTDEQFAARELVRSWAAGSNAVKAAREIEQGDPDAWRAPYAGLAQLGIFGVALPEECGGADGTVDDLCAMVDEAAAAMVPGPIATTAVATLVVPSSRADLLEALASGERTAGMALTADLDYQNGGVSGTAEYVLGADAAAVLLLPVSETEFVLVDAGADGVTVEPLTPTDFSRPLARVVLADAPAEVLPASRQRVEDLAATVLAAETAGLARWTLRTATEYAKVREQFGKPIGSFQAVKHMCAEMLLRSEQVSVAASDAARAANDDDDHQLSVAAAVAAAAGIEMAKANAKDCIQVLGGIGITWEHDAHLYLRRAYGISQFLGGASRWLRRVASLTQQGVRRELHIDLASVEHLQPEIAAAVADVAAQPVEKRQIALAEAGSAGAALAEAVRPRRLAGRAAADRPGVGGGRCRPPRPGDRLVGGADDPRARQPRADRTIRAADAERRAVLVPAVQRARRGLRPCVVAYESRSRRRWLAADRPEGVDVDGRTGRSGACAWPAPTPMRRSTRASRTSSSTWRSPGIDIRPLREITGDDLFNEVFFDDVFVPDEMVVGEVNDGWRLARTTLANERVAMAHGTALGNPMEELLRTVAELELDPAVQDRLGRLIVAAQVGSLLDQRIAQLAVGGADPGPQASARKLIGVRYRQALSEFRMDLSDGAGLVENQPVHDFLNVRCLTIAGGTEQILLTMAGERLLGLPR